MEKLKRAVLYEEYYKLLGDSVEAMVLSQMVYRQQRKKDFDKFIEEENKIRNGHLEDLEVSSGWIYKTSKDLSEEIMIASSRTVNRCLTSLVEKGYLERRNNPKYNRDKTYQYRIVFGKLVNDLIKLSYTIPNWEHKVDYTTIGQNGQSIRQDGEAIPETTTKTTKILDTLQKDLEGDVSFLVFDSSTQYEYVDRLLYEHGVVYEELNTKNFPTKVYKICEMIDKVALEYKIKTVKNSRTINKFGYLMFGKNMDLQEIVDLVEEQSDCEFEDIEGLIYSCKGFQFEDF